MTTKDKDIVISTKGAKEMKDEQLIDSLIASARRSALSANRSIPQKNMAVLKDEILRRIRKQKK